MGTRSFARGMTIQAKHTNETIAKLAAEHPDYTISSVDPAFRAELLTVYEVADELRLVPHTVRNYIDRGELKAIRIGSRRVRVTRAALTEFLGVRRETSQQPKQPPPADSGCP